MSSRISDLSLSYSIDDNMIDFEIRFKVVGRVRDVFNQDTWLDAYNKHDNLFRIRYTLTLNYGKNTRPITFIRKASLYWSRDPTLPPFPPAKKIWCMIVSDDKPIIPSSVEEARSLLFDVKSNIILSSNLLDKEHSVYADVKASWGRHTFIEKEEIGARSNAIAIRV